MNERSMNSEHSDGDPRIDCGSWKTEKDHFDFLAQMGCSPQIYGPASPIGGLGLWTVSPRMHLTTPTETLEMDQWHSEQTLLDALHSVCSEIQFWMAVHDGMEETTWPDPFTRKPL